MNSKHPAITHSFSDTYVVWGDSEHGIAFARIANNGTEPGAPIYFATRGDFADPQVAASDNLVYVVWAEIDPSDYRNRVWLAISEDYGHTFSQPRQITKNGHHDIWKPHLIALGQDAWVTWTENEPDAIEPGIHVYTILGAGTSRFELESYLYTCPKWTSCYDNAITATTTSSGSLNVYVVWDDEGWLKLARSTDEGQHFEPAKTLGLSNTGYPHLVSDNDDVYVLYSNWLGYYSNMTLAVSNDAGATFHSIQVGNACFDGCVGELAVDGSRVAIAWSSNHAIFNQLVSDHGNSLGAVTLVSPMQGAFYGSPHVALKDSSIAIVYDDEFSLWKPHALVAASQDGGQTFQLLDAGDAFGSQPLPFSYEPAVVIYDNGNFGVVWTSILSGTMLTGDYHIFFRIGGKWSGDLSFVRSPQAIQAPEGSMRLAKGKLTSIKADLFNGFPGKVSITVRLSYTFGGVSDSKDTTVELKPGANTIYLPKDSFRPLGSDLNFTLQIDPQGRILETDENNNNDHAAALVYDTHPLRVLVVPVAVAGEATIPDNIDLEVVRQAGQGYVDGTFPLDDRESVWTVESGSPIRIPAKRPTDQGMDAFLKHIGSLANGGDYDKVIAVVRKGWFRDYYDTPGEDPILGIAGYDSGNDANKGALVDMEALKMGGVVVAHELAHTFGWVTIELSSSGYESHMNGVPAPGYWVARHSAKQGNDFMNYFNRTKDWVSLETYNHLFDRLLTVIGGLGPQVLTSTQSLVVSGVISGDGSLLSDAWYTLDAPPELPLDNPGELTLEYHDAAGALLAQTGFDLSYLTAMGEAATPAQSSSSDPGFFQLRLPDVPTAASLVLKRAGQVIYTRQRSAHAPQVTVAYPNGGESFRVGDALPLAWSAWTSTATRSVSSSRSAPITAPPGSR